MQKHLTQNLAIVYEVSAVGAMNSRSIILDAGCQGINSIEPILCSKSARIRPDEVKFPAGVLCSGICLSPEIAPDTIGLLVRPLPQSFDSKMESMQYLRTFKELHFHFHQAGAPYIVKQVHISKICF